MIYKAILVRPHEIVPMVELSRSNRYYVFRHIYYGALKIEMSILNLSKLVYQEAYHIFCVHNSFKIWDISCIMEIIAKQNFVHEVRELSIDWQHHRHDDIQKLFDELKNLKVVHVRGPTYCQKAPLLCSSFVTQLMTLRGLQKFSFTERRVDTTGVYKRESEELESILQKVTMYPYRTVSASSLFLGASLRLTIHSRYTSLITCHTKAFAIQMHH